MALKFLLRYAVQLIWWKVEQNPEQFSGNSHHRRPHRLLLRMFSKLFAISNKSASMKEKDICVFLDRKVLSPRHLVENASLSASLCEASWPLRRERSYLVNKDKLCLLAEICKGRGCLKMDKEVIVFLWLYSRAGFPASGAGSQRGAECACHLGVTWSSQGQSCAPWKEPKAFEGAESS